MTGSSISSDQEFNDGTSQSGSARSGSSDQDDVARIDNSFSFNLLYQSLMLVITVLLICFNIDKMDTVLQKNISLFAFMMGSLVISILEIVLNLIFRAKLRLDNKLKIYRTSVISSVLINLYSLWGFFLMFYGPKTVPGLFSNASHNQKE